MKVIATCTAVQLASGSIARWIDATASRFVPTRVLDSTGTVIALFNPVWLLQSPPPGGIPPSRGA